MFVSQLIFHHSRRTTWTIPRWVSCQQIYTAKLPFQQSLCCTVTTTVMTCYLVTDMRWLNTGKLCHRGKCHSGNCHSGERWMSRPFVQWQFKFQAHFDKWFGPPQCLKTYHLSPYNIKDMLLTGPFAMLSMPSFDFHLPPCTEGFLIHLSPLWQLPLFPSVAQFPCVY